MSVKIRLSRKGRKKKPMYSIIVADARSPRDGKFIEKIGTYNPLTSPATIEVERDRALYWLDCGAQPTDTVRAILGFKGVLYKKHLQRGVKKGAFSQEVADQKFNDWLNAKEEKIADRVKKKLADAEKAKEEALKAESKIRAAKEAKQAGAAATAVSEKGGADGSQAESANAPGDAIGDAIANAQADSEEILGIKKEEGTENKEAEKAPAKEEKPKAEEKPEEAKVEEPKTEEKAEAPKVEEKPAEEKVEEVPAEAAKGDDPELDKAAE